MCLAGLLACSAPSSGRSDAGGSDAGGSDAGGSDAGGSGATPMTFTDTVVMFHLNMQEHGHLSEAVEIATRVLDLHEELGVPLDVYLTTWMVDDLEGTELFSRLVASPLVSVNYHTRPPLPYRANFCVGSNPCEDWYGLHAMDESAQKAAVLAFESARIDLATGQRLNTSGGFAKLTAALGRPPWVAGVESNGRQLQRVVDEAFQEMGVTFVTSHAVGGSAEGDERNGVPIKPEAVDVKMFNTDTSLDNDACVATNMDGAALYDCEVARCAGPAPCTVAFKMHDNDFLSHDAWWGLVYAKKGPNWNTALQTPLYAADDLVGANFQWTRYEQVVRRAAERRSVYAIVGARHWAARR